MDWTGGTRRLYASNPQKNAVIRRQKNYFAKARANAAVQSATLTPDAAPGANTRSRPRPPTSSSVHSHRAQKDSHIHSRRLDLRGVRVDEDLRKSTVSGFRPPSSSRAIKSCGSSHTKRTFPNYTGMANMSDEDRLLMANRQRLLARKDWLGLAPTRPLHMTFPSEHEGRIGKRRKIVKQWLPKTPGKVHRRPTPPFQEEPPSSGAVHGDDLRIKVGTDAFASQTQPSRVSTVSINTSLRHPSTDLGPISEESMLLDAEDGELGLNEPDFSHVQEYLDRRQLSPRLYEESLNIESPWAVSRGSDQDLEYNRDPPSAEVQTEHSNGPLLHRMPRDPSPLSRHHLGTSAILDRDSATASATYPGQGKISWQQWHNPFIAESSKLPNRTSLERRITTSDDERAWRRAVGVRRSPSVNASVAVLRSDSLHATQSSATCWPQPESAPSILRIREELKAQIDLAQQAECPQLQAKTAAEPFYSALAKFDGAQQRDLSHPPLMDELGGNEFDTYSRSAVAQKDGLHRIESCDEEAKDEALWRSFIVGSQESCSSERVGGAWNADMMENMAPASPTLSEQACSDRVTIGDTTYAAPSSADCAPRSRTDSKTFYDNTSLLGHATTAVDDISDGQEYNINDDPGGHSSISCQTSVRPGLHVTTSVLSARRFKRPKGSLDRRQPSIAPASRFLPRERQRCCKARSVYDAAS